MHCTVCTVYVRQTASNKFIVISFFFQELDSTVFHLDRERSDLSSGLVELQHVSRSEHETSLNREQDLVEKVANMTTTIADITSTNTGIYIYNRFLCQDLSLSLSLSQY